MQQQRSSPRQRPFDLSSEIHLLARKEELGELRQVYFVKKENTTNFGIGMLCIVIGIFLILPLIPLIYPIAPAQLILAGLIVTLLVVGLYITLSRRIYERWHIYLWENGFIYEKKRVLQAFRWNRIESIEGSPSLAPNLQSYYFYKIRRQDGYKIKLDYTFPGTTELIDTMLEECSRHLASHRISIMPRRNISTFTHLKLDRQGISNGQQSVSWEEVQELATNNGTVTIRKKVEDE